MFFYIQGNFMSLIDLSLGQKARVIKVNSAVKKFKIRMADLGFIPGCVVCVKRIAPLKDPIEVSLHGYSLSLGKYESSKVEVTI